MSQILSLLLLRRVRKTILRILLITALRTEFSTIFSKTRWTFVKIYAIPLEKIAETPILRRLGICKDHIAESGRHKM